MEDYGFPVQSYLRNCVFSWQDHEPPPGSSLTRLSQVQGFLFQGCSWISAFSTPGLRALEAADAGLTLREGTCPGSPCLIGPKGVIRGFDLGLEVWSAYGITPGPVYIAQTTFRACRRSLLLRGLDAAVLQSLDVEVPAAGGLAWPYATYGLHLEACRNTLVTASSFAGLGPLPLGVLAYAGDFYPAEISSCRFSGLRAALVVLGPNGNARSGLQLSCNRFSGNDADVWMAPGDAAPSMARYQSDCVYQPAGNRFSAEAAGLNWLLDPSAKHTWYFHHSGLDFTPSVSDSLLLRSVDCGRPYQAKDCPILPVLPLNQAADSIRILHTLAEQLEASIDNGSTEELLRLIAAPGVGAGVMQFALSEANPYLSDTVLLSLIHRYPDVTPWFFQFLLESNSPLSQPVLAAALAVLPASARDALLVFQGPAPNTRELLRARVASVRKRLQRWEARRFIAAWQADQRDSLLLFAEGDPDRLARLLSANQQWAALDRLMRSGGADTLARSPLLTLFLQLASEGRSLAELNTVELEQLENLAFQPGALGVSAALALRTYDGRVAQEPLPTEDPDPRQASLSFGERGLPSSASASQNQAVLRGVPGRYRIYPNPAGDQLLVQGVAGQESWQLLDANGTMRGSGQLPPGGVLSLRNLPPGLYALRIAADHTGSAQTLTFVKAP